MLCIPELLCGLFHYLLEVLVILAGVPVSTPGEAMLLKQLIAQIVFVNFVGEGSGSVCVCGSICRRYFFAAILTVSNIRIIKGIDINCQP